MLKTTCELPKCMLGMEDELNDFDFVLYHQYLKDEVYRNNYLNKRILKPERMMILDNSAYEFFLSGEQFIESDFIRVINELKPDYYIVPDVLMDKEKTISNFMHWVPIVKSIKFSNPYFVPQGRTYSEFMDCINKMDIIIRENNLPKNFCIPFHNDFFKDTLWSNNLFYKYFHKKNATTDDYYAVGRMVLMNKLYEDGIYIDYKYHMLGSHNPREIKFYKSIPMIKSFDSAYPVKLAVSGIEFGKEKYKPEISYDDFGDDLSDSTKDLIILNINKMKQLKNSI